MAFEDVFLRSYHNHILDKIMSYLQVQDVLNMSKLNLDLEMLIHADKRLRDRVQVYEKAKKFYMPLISAACEEGVLWLARDIFEGRLVPEDTFKHYKLAHSSPLIKAVRHCHWNIVKYVMRTRTLEGSDEYAIRSALQYAVGKADLEMVTFIGKYKIHPCMQMAQN